MTTKPTREEVELWKYESAHSPLHDHAFENHNRLIYLADAYLAQEEELRTKDTVMKHHTESMILRGKRIDELQAENQALKDDVARLKTPTIIGSYERETIVFDQDEEDTLP